MMAAKSTPFLNEVPIRRTKRSTAGINSRYNQTPSSFQKKSTRKSSKSTPLHANAKNFTSKNSSTSENKSSFSESATKQSIDGHTLKLGEIKRLETRLENQISKTNVLEKELEGLKKENAFLKIEPQSQLNNIKFIINKNNDKDIDCNDFNISESAVNEQNVESNLDFNVIRDKSPAALTPLSVPWNKERETLRKDYCNAVKRSVTAPVSPQVSSSNVVIKCPQVSSSNTNVNRASNVSAKNDSYPLQPFVKRKTNRTGKPNLLIVGDSHIKCVEKDLIVHHLNNKNISLKCKKFDGADVRRIQHHLLPALHEDQLDGIIFYGGKNDITHNKLHTTRPHDLASKIIDIGNVCKSFGITKIAISSILPRKDQECQKRIDETNNYLKDFCGFYGFSFIDKVTLLNTFCIMMS